MPAADGDAVGGAGEPDARGQRPGAPAARARGPRALRDAGRPPRGARPQGRRARAARLGPGARAHAGGHRGPRERLRRAAAPLRRAHLARPPGRRRPRGAGRGARPARPAAARRGGAGRGRPRRARRPGCSAGRATAPSARRRSGPDNCLLTGSGARFLDFEWGCFRDVALMGASLRLPLPSGGPGARAAGRAWPRRWSRPGRPRSRRSGASSRTSRCCASGCCRPRCSGCGSRPARCCPPSWASGRRAGWPAWSWPTRARTRPRCSARSGGASGSDAERAGHVATAELAAAVVGALGRHGGEAVLPPYPAFAAAAGVGGSGREQPGAVDERLGRRAGPAQRARVAQRLGVAAPGEQQQEPAGIDLDGVRGVLRVGPGRRCRG